MSKPARAIAGVWWLLICGSVAATEQDSTELVTAYIEAWNSGEVDGLDSVVSPDFARRGGIGSVQSIDDLRTIIEGSRSFYPGLQLVVHDLVADTDSVALRWSFTGGYADTDFQLDYMSFSWFRVAENRLVEELVIGHRVGRMADLGYRLVPPEATVTPPPFDDPERVPSPFPGSEELQAWAAETQAAGNKKAGVLEVSAEVGATLVLDGEELGGLEMGDKVVLHVDRGKHFLEARSRFGSTIFRQSVKVGREPISLEITAPRRVLIDPRRSTSEDLHTGLMWPLRDNGKDSFWGAADEYCRNSEHGGFTDWRLPTIYELQEIYDPETAVRKTFHTIDGVTLTSCCPWSSSQQGTGYYWTFIFYKGVSYLQHHTFGSYQRALCVRDAEQ